MADPAVQSMLHTASSHMFAMPLPLFEKIARPVIVYLCLIGFLRLFGKRELAQLNPFDLVVLLSLSNTVQNAIIGDDNSVTGGIVGAFSLLAINWVLMWLLYRAPKINAALQGHPSTLIRDGEVDAAEMRRQSLTDEDLASALAKSGFTEVKDVATCVLEPNGTFFVKGKTPSSDDEARAELKVMMERLHGEVASLRAELQRHRAA